jgi:hypothetical protein
MWRRDVLRGSLLMGGGALLAGLPLASPVWAGPVEMRLIVLLEGDTRIDSLIATLGRTPDEIWRLPAGQWLQPDDYVARLAGRAGSRLCSSLGAANHCRFSMLCACRRCPLSSERSGRGITIRK